LSSIFLNINFRKTQNDKKNIQTEVSLLLALAKMHCEIEDFFAVYF